MTRLPLIVTSLVLGFACDRPSKEPLAVEKPLSVQTATTTRAAETLPRTEAAPATGQPTAVTPGATTPTFRVTTIPHFFPETSKTEPRRPLLMFLHGFGATGQISFDVLKLGDFGKRHRVFVLAPDGALDSKNRRFWNAHAACCNFDAIPIDHVSYLKSLVDEMVEHYAVDPKRLYIIGFSNGGFMAHRLACEWPDGVAGIVSVAGAGPNPNASCRPSPGIRVLEMHGDADSTVSYEGGTLFDRPNETYISAKTTFDNWAKRLGCRNRLAVPGPAFDLVPNLPGAETEPLTHEGCPYGTVALWTVHGGTHLFGNRPSVLEKAWLYLNPDSR